MAEVRTTMVPEPAPEYLRGRAGLCRYCVHTHADHYVTFGGRAGCSKKDRVYYDEDPHCSCDGFLMMAYSDARDEAYWDSVYARECADG